MNLRICPDAAPNFLGLFDLAIAPPLLYYSYIPLFVLCLFFGVYTLIKDNYSVLSQYFLALCLFFASYIFLSIVQWIAAGLVIVHFAWQIYLFAETGIYIFSALLAYVFLFQKDVTTVFKLCTELILIAIAAILPTQLNISAFDLQNCEGVSGAIWPFVYIFELVCLIIIMLIAFVRLHANHDHNDTIKTILFSTGLIFFLGIFWSSNYFAELTSTYEINLIGPIGIFIFLGSLAYMLVKFKLFNTKIFASQVLVIALIFLIAALIFVREIEYVRIVVIFTLVLVGFLGVNLIRSVKKEIEQREKIEKLAKELELANNQLKELDRQKDLLISIVSHQLNTPVTSVKWNIEMMLDGDMGKVTEEQKTQLQTIQTVTTDLADLVSMLLDVSRIQLGRMKVDRTDLRLDEFFNEILAVIEPKVQQKKQKFVKNIPAMLPVAMLDKRLMRMTLENLLANAVKYTPDGGEVIFTVTVEGDKLRYSVKDTGYGIPKAEQGKIFGQLFRASNVQKVDGNGLGLFAAKGAVEAQEGSIRFESEEGKGTTFYVELPIIAPEEKKG